MKVLPQGKNLAFVATFCMLGGLYPVHLLTDNKSVQKVYKMYNHLLKLLLLLCFTSSYTQLYILLSAEELIYEEIAQNISISLLLVLMSLRQILIRSSSDVPKLLSNIGSAEQQFRALNDFPIRNIIEKERKFFKRHFVAYLLVMIALCGEYIIMPFYYQEAPSGNATDLSKPFLFSLWFPYDQRVYYWETYCISIVIIGLMVISQTTTDILFFCFIRHPVVQLQIMHQYLKHFQLYCNQLQSERGKMDESYISMLKICIEIHWETIEFVDIVNRSFSSIMIMDFVQSSFRITSVLCVLAMSNSADLMVVIFILSFLGLTFVREYYAYDSGSEIMFLSSELGDLAFATNWYEQSCQFKFMLQFFIQRTQKPLTLKIGAFANFSLAALVSMLPRGKQQAFIARICMLSGLYPVEFLPADKVLRLAYTIYYRALILLYFLTLMSSSMELYNLLNAETLAFDEIMGSISMLTLFVMTSLRQCIIRFTPEVQNMLRYAGYLEVRTYEENDSAVVEIFEKAGKFANWYYICYAVGTVFLCLGIMLQPFYAGEASSGNGTIHVRKFPLALWFPYDIQVYFWETFILSPLILSLLVVFQVSVDFLFFYVIRSPVIQLQILDHSFKHFNDYTEQLSLDRRNIEDDSASILMMEKCIQMHWDVIKFVDIFNKSFSNIMIMDFVQSSFRIATIVASIRMTDSATVASFLFTLVFLWITLLREYYIYYSGNELVFLSSELKYSVYETDWYKAPRHFQFMVKMIMMRADKRLRIKIGPFGVLGLSAFLSILRASYSYLSLATGNRGS